MNLSYANGSRGASKMSKNRPDFYDQHTSIATRTATTGKIHRRFNLWRIGG
ncbi:unknown [[Mannheimia] succiniciproducens MBEL55E]|uniref:Uncharacterized protein n=1 Tax=Mannheimia succiniciproducens (strain KCTC 0769BP / MBEL55E) TaxID=221988 RepID=Q65UW7_MANSM|nr:unknown [[Mannheimia] succiniciproducens MBEL55E]